MSEKFRWRCEAGSSAPVAEDVFAARPEEGALLQGEGEDVGELLGAVAAQRMDELIHVPLVETEDEHVVELHPGPVRGGLYLGPNGSAGRGGRMEEAWFLFEGDSLVSLFCSKSMRRRICTTHGRQSEGQVLRHQYIPLIRP